MPALLLKITFFAAAFIPLAVLAQSASTLPACVTNCISSSATVAGCAQNNTSCLCSATSLFPQTVGTCLGTQCNVMEITQGRNAVLSLCNIISSSAPSGTPTGRASATASTTSSTVSTSRASSVATPTPTSPAAAVASAASSASSSASASATSARASANAAPASFGAPAHWTLGSFGAVAFMFFAA
ncbi:hypothetical protein K488DRAFT_86179 [Vararia minispora EC-137]|uniref:Uncharacterized protein n=1 Tax=Vararia minispora EC-137 TaxID=1314806 RepID=A0ACB8QL37_9AGAM|nr:hypothetical protein K488DRAFT_86179 [Vararia minispora EC-137]